MKLMILVFKDFMQIGALFANIYLCKKKKSYAVTNMVAERTDLLSKNIEMTLELL